MVPRRKRNWDLSGVKERYRQEQSTHGINWDTDRLKKGRYITSYSWLVNVAVREYLTKK